MIANPSLARNDSELRKACTEAVYEEIVRQSEGSSDCSAWGDRTDVVLDGRRLDARKIALQVLSVVQSGLA